MGLKAAVPFVGMVMAECAQVGLMILSKAAMSDGMTNFIFVLYSNALASLILLPSSFFLHRSERPPLTFPVLCGFFLLGLFGWLAQIFGYAGINLSSATLGTAMLNLIPGLTFILAVAFRMEKLDWRSSSALVKSTGTIVSVAGAFIVCYYKGPPLLMAPSTSNLPHELLSQQQNWIIGGLLLAVDCVMASAWLIIQALILKKYPAGLIVVFFYCFTVTILSTIVCLFMERDPGAWSLKPTVRWIAVVYSGVFGSAFQVGISTWCLHKTGPVFVAMFKPLGIVIAAAVSIICLRDTLYLGRYIFFFLFLFEGGNRFDILSCCQVSSIPIIKRRHKDTSFTILVEIFSLVGATVIVIGFYSVMWGKAKEEKVGVDDGVRSFESSSQKVPLLQSHAEET
uniref:WAT1-related protein n=1 Tax=Populus davidiana TaxID=266767 RepID=A0A6M2ECA7_9ROSI